MFTNSRTRIIAGATFAPLLAAVLATAGDDIPPKAVVNQIGAKADGAKKSESPPSPAKFGVLQNDSRACPGYNLINPGRQQTYLYDNEGRVVHTWTSEHKSRAAVYLLDNGHLFRPAEAVNRQPGFLGPAAGGRIQEFDWDGKLVWDFEYHSAERLPHHDAIKLPNGNALLVCWEWIKEQEAVAKGRRPETVKEAHLQPDCLVEIRPTGLTTGEIVWEWRSWDHLIQDHDETKQGFGDVAAHPELFDVNYIHNETDSPPRDGAKPDPQAVAREYADWMHVNAVAYNPELDQIALSSPHFHEIWIIDHSTTTQQAAGHTGGRWGQGGDILYRWGNPRAYRKGTAADQRLFFQHNIHWIPKGLPGENHLLVFNNGAGRKPVEYSSVDEFIPPTDQNGHYLRSENGTFGPDKPVWSYAAPNPSDFFSWFISGAQRLPNGNTLINSGAVGVVFEVTPEKDTVWKLANPFKRAAGPPPTPAQPPKRFEAIAGASRDALGMSPEQRKKLDEIDSALTAKLDQILTAEQIKSFATPQPSDDAILSKLPPGEYLAMFQRSTPELPDAVKKELHALQTEFNPKITEILTDAQKKLVADFKLGQRAAAPATGTPRRPGNTLFRATRYAANHPAFAGRTLTPGKTLVEIEAEFDQQSQANAAAEAKAK